jgi:hypothetical protein
LCIDIKCATSLTDVPSGGPAARFTYRCAGGGEKIVGPRARGSTGR